MAGIASVALGSALYLGAHLGPGPRDGLMVAIHSRTGWRVGTARAVLECVVLVLGVLLGGPVGVGTLMFALGIGPAVQLAFRLPRQMPCAARRGAGMSGPYAVGSGRSSARVCRAVAVLVLLVFGIVAVAARQRAGGPRDVRAPRPGRLRRPGLLLAAAVAGFSRARVRADADGIEVRNVLSYRRFPWGVVREVRLDEGTPWASLELQDDDTVAMLGIAPTTASAPSTRCWPCGRCWPPAAAPDDRVTIRRVALAASRSRADSSPSDAGAAPLARRSPGTWSCRPALPAPGGRCP